MGDSDTVAVSKTTQAARMESGLGRVRCPLVRCTLRVPLASDFPTIPRFSMLDGKSVLRTLGATSLIFISLIASSMLTGGCGSDTKVTEGSIGGGLGNIMAILSCSLGCSTGTLGYPVTCGTATIKANEEIAIEFTQPVDLASVTKTSFRIKDALTGLSPPGVFIIDPSNARRVIFRPKISFDSAGSPEFGFDLGHSYSIRLNGELHTTGPYVTSTSGRENLSALNCNISVTSGLVDPSPGPSELTILVDRVTSYGPDGEVLSTEEDIVNGPSVLTDVWNLSSIRLYFNDIISPVTLLSPGGETSPNVRVYIDPDGLVGGSDDWIKLTGALELDLDESTLSSTLTFRPDSGFPSAGSGALPRRIVIEVLDGVMDLAGFPLANPGVYSFIPEAQLFGEVQLPAGGEDFADFQFLDVSSSGALLGSGQMTAGYGGGAGQHGPLRVNLSNSPFTLDTDSQQFQNFGVIVEGGATFPPSTTAPSVTVTDGVFEFSSLEIENDGQVFVVGSNPARIFVRGQALIQGLLSSIGQTPPDDSGSGTGHLSNELAGGLPGFGGAAAGSGGRGADRPDNSGTTLLFLPGPGNGVPNPGAVVDGFEGEGVGGAAAALNLGGGEGGVHWPNVMPFGWTDFGDFQPSDLCQGDQVANPGAGGGYSTSGKVSNAIWPNPLANDPAGVGLTPPSDAIGGDPLDIGLTPLMMELSPELGNLRGGSGGGGGGAHVHLTRTNGPAFGNCLLGSINFYVSHSAAGGGGGGGAIQLQAGSEVRITGLIDLSGGPGGNATDPGGFGLDAHASPGGGGSGGAMLIQSRQVLFSALTTALDLSGGPGGTGVGLSKGGAGGAGVLRIESEFAVNPLEIAAKVSPFDGTAGSEFGGPDSSNIFTSSSWTTDLDGAGSRSGAQSCWLRPSGFFFQVIYGPEDLSDPLDPALGWDMKMFTPGDPSTSFSYRDKNDPNNPFADSPEALFGTDLGGLTPAPVLVRFQGARIGELPENLCDADFVENGGSIALESLTPWVRHPSELNSYWDTALPGDPQEAESRRPNLIRYSIVFDRASPSWSAFGGLESFEILAKPD